MINYCIPFFKNGVFLLLCRGGYEFPIISYLNPQFLGISDVATNRSYTPREARLVHEYSKKAYPNCLQWKRVRVGPLPNLKNARMYGVLRRYADLVIDTPDHVVIIEAKIRPDPGAIQQVMLYKELFPETPEFSSINHKPIKMVFLTTTMDKVVKRLAERQGVEFVVFAPQWVKDYIKELLARK